MSGGKATLHVRVTIDGRELEALAGKSILQAWLDAGLALTRGVGCFGQGVCGSCRAMVRRQGQDEVQMELACETPVEAGMQVVFVDDVQDAPRHLYALDEARDGWRLLETVGRLFPEAQQCRHCGGCDRACPKGLAVEAAVGAANAGRVSEAARTFDECVMCNLCTMTCPEHIEPNHLGLFLRRVSTRMSVLPGDLAQRIQQIERGEMTLRVPTSGAED